MNRFDCSIFFNNHEFRYCNSYNSEYNTRYIAGEEMSKMILYQHPITQTWIDDHLDLYNYAREIGDIQ